MLKNKDNYLSAQIVLEFVDYFAELIDGKPFHHQYHFRKPGLYEGFEKKHQVTNGNLTIHSLEDAYKKYWWDNKDYAENKRILDKISKKIKEYRRGEESREECLKVLERVLEWGAGNKYTKLFVSNMDWAKSKKNIDKLMEDGVKEMQKHDPNPKLFDNEKGPRMNAGFTKYYALACEDVIIYDGRVAAALGFLTKKYLKQESRDWIPDELNFGYTGNKYRNPNKCEVNYELTNKFKLIISHHHHAESNIRANWIISEAMGKVKDKEWDSEKIDMRKIEAALFILGYSL